MTFLKKQNAVLQHAASVLRPLLNFHVCFPDCRKLRSKSWLLFSVVDDPPPCKFYGSRPPEECIQVNAMFYHVAALTTSKHRGRITRRVVH